MSEVVIVGAGPTGLLAAGLLARSGVSVRILDKNPGPVHESRAFGVQARTLELMASIGLAEEFMNRGLIASGAQLFVDGGLVGELNFDDLGRSDTPYSFLLMVPQWEIEAILNEDLVRLGVVVERGMEAIGFRQLGEGLIVSARTAAGQATEIPCAYLIGADGAHSIVRKTLGLRFEGAPYPQGFLLADCAIEWPFDYDHLKVFLHGRNFALYIPLKGRTMGRLIVLQPFEAPSTPEAVEASGSEPASLAEVEAAIREVSQSEVRLSAPVWLSRYRIHHRGVDRYGVGRAFVAGDAAHIHSPAGAQGMNTGLQDAANLAWKLACVIKGGAPQALLDSYNAERWPIGQKILGFTDRLFAGVAAQSDWAIALRNMVAPILAATLTRSGGVRSRVFHFISQLGIRYHDNPFLRDECSQIAPRAWRQGLTAGHRAPDALIAHNRDLFSLIVGYRFHLLALSRRPLGSDEIDALAGELARLPTAIGLPLGRHIIAHSLVGRTDRLIQAESNQIFEAYGLSRACPQALFLVRPDGYIAYRSDTLAMAGLKAFLAERFLA